PDEADRSGECREGRYPPCVHLQGRVQVSGEGHEGGEHARCRCELAFDHGQQRRLWAGWRRVAVELTSLEVEEPTELRRVVRERGGEVRVGWVGKQANELREAQGGR